MFAPSNGNFSSVGPLQKLLFGVSRREIIKTICVYPDFIRYNPSKVWYYYRANNQFLFSRDLNIIPMDYLCLHIFHPPLVDSFLEFSHSGVLSMQDANRRIGARKKAEEKQGRAVT